jgi:hypothetical protein
LLQLVRLIKNYGTPALLVFPCFLTRNLTSFYLLYNLRSAWYC